jgi:hypothetical protein
MIKALISSNPRDGVLDSNLQLHMVIESCRDGISDSKYPPVHNQTLVKWGNASYLDNKFIDIILTCIHVYVFQFISLALKILDSN